ncbi:hypothetical protein DRJ17_02420 [Candidatus Woesearchaeota archaeon]|nr:MAG: hypothetical protein DRJ17_02420 [Candidatus Woesearchaeota archaeon]
MKEIFNIFEHRRDRILSIIKKRSDELHPNELQQLYGALREINLMLKTLKHQMDVRSNIEKIELQPASKVAVLSAVTSVFM